MISTVRSISFGSPPTFIGSPGDAVDLLIKRLVKLPKTASEQSRRARLTSQPENLTKLDQLMSEIERVLDESCSHADSGHFNPAQQIIDLELVGLNDADAVLDFFGDSWIDKIVIIVDFSFNDYNACIRGLFMLIYCSYRSNSTTYLQLKFQRE